MEASQKKALQQCQRRVPPRRPLSRRTIWLRWPNWLETLLANDSPQQLPG